MADLAGGAARRRSGRRLHSWLRHERMTVRMELAAALHHSAGPQTNDAARSQKTVGSRGVRPGVLQDPAPQLVSEHAACLCSSEVPSLSLPVLADRAAEVVDSCSLRFLTASALEARREEEKVKVKEKERKRLAVHETLERARLWAEEKERHLAEHEADAATLEQARLWAEEKAKRRKRKKRRKRRTPRTSSRSLRGLARRRQLQWHACGAGSPGYVPLRAVFPSVSGRLEMLGIMAGMDQKGFFKFVDIPFVP